MTDHLIIRAEKPEDYKANSTAGSREPYTIPGPGWSTVMPGRKSLPSGL